MADFDSQTGPLIPLDDPSPLQYPENSHDFYAGPPTDYHHFTDSELAILQASTLTISTISLLAGFFTFYWFVRMRRSFRHDLIMLLILCDMWKAVWFMTFPILEFFKGKPIESSSGFCQASGFFLAMGTEACDIVILMIALHTAFYIFRPGQTESGLYPYRKSAYVALTVVPIIMASLAFAGGPGYVNLGEYCYLPVRPDVYRLALSWVPRYFIFGVILTIYASLYIYIRMLMNRYSKASGGASKRPAPVCLNLETCSRFNDQTFIPPMPPLAYHGLVSVPGSRCGSARPSTERDYDLPYADFTDLESHKLSREEPPWKWPPKNFDEADFRPQPLRSNPPFGQVPTSPESKARAITTTMPQTTPPRRMYSGRNLDLSPTESSSSPSSWLKRTTSAATSNTYRPLLRALSTTTGRNRSCPVHSPSAEHRPTTLPSHTPNSGHISFLGADALDRVGMEETREKIKRQLRMLFVYPLVYMITWIIPFISHILCYSNTFIGAHEHPFWLLVFSLMSLTAQGAVDCWLFASRERPWRHATKGFWETFRGCLTETEEINGGVKGPGRTREEMLVDGRQARLRRDEEIAERKEGLKKSSTEQKRSMEWWEAGIGGSGVRWSQMAAPKPRRRTENLI